MVHRQGSNLTQIEQAPRCLVASLGCAKAPRQQFQSHGSRRPIQRNPLRSSALRVLARQTLAVRTCNGKHSALRVIPQVLIATCIPGGSCDRSSQSPRAPARMNNCSARPRAGHRCLQRWVTHAVRPSIQHRFPSRRCPSCYRCRYSKQAVQDRKGVSFGQTLVRSQNPPYRILYGR
jgi:hypothetical protein